MKIIAPGKIFSTILPCPFTPKAQWGDGRQSFLACLIRGKQLMQIIPKRHKLQIRKIRRRLIEFQQRIAQMLDHAVADAATQLMMGRSRLNQALHKKAPRLCRMALPDFFPGFVRFPIFAGVEQRNAFGQIGAVGLSELRREPVRAGRGRRQPVQARRSRRGRCGWSILRLCGSLHQNPTFQW